MNVDEGELVPGFEDAVALLLAVGVSRRRIQRWTFDVIARAAATREAWTVTTISEAEMMAAARTDFLAWAEALHPGRWQLDSNRGQRAAREAWRRARERSRIRLRA